MKKSIYTSKDDKQIKTAWESLHIVLQSHCYRNELSKAQRLAKKWAYGGSAHREAQAMVLQEFLRGFDKPEIPAHCLCHLAEWAQIAVMQGANYKLHFMKQGTEFWQTYNGHVVTMRQGLRAHNEAFDHHHKKQLKEIRDRYRQQWVSKGANE